MLKLLYENMTTHEGKEHVTLNFYTDLIMSGSS